MQGNYYSESELMLPKKFCSLSNALTTNFEQLGPNLRLPGKIRAACNQAEPFCDTYPCNSTPLLLLGGENSPALN